MLQGPTHIKKYLWYSAQNIADRCHRVETQLQLINVKNIACKWAIRKYVDKVKVIVN